MERQDSSLNTGENVPALFPGRAQTGPGFLLLPQEVTVKAVQLQLLFVHISAQLSRVWDFYSSDDSVSDKEFCFHAFC